MSYLQREVQSVSLGEIYQVQLTAFSWDVLCHLTILQHIKHEKEKNKTSNN